MGFVGRTEPRLWTKPLRELTPETTLGFEVIAFARDFLRIELRPWQRWLLIHALELKPDGTYRFRRVIVLVARQNGKTLLASVLAAWWLFIDSLRHPARVPPVDFKIVGTAQNLDIAREPWSSVKLWCDPEPDTDAARIAAIPVLQSETAKVSDTNGKEFILAQSLAHYEIRAAKNARGKPAARVLMDELREQQTWVAWNA
ncbi:MAG: terminase, partial [Veillonellaceae bacterium]|nr:terminase [Veillonellaceae bacterium]